MASFKAQIRPHGLQGAVEKRRKRGCEKAPKVQACTRGPSDKDSSRAKREARGRAESARSWKKRRRSQGREIIRKGTRRAYNIIKLTHPEGGEIYDERGGESGFSPGNPRMTRPLPPW